MSFENLQMIDVYPDGRRKGGPRRTAPVSAGHTHVQDEDAETCKHADVAASPESCTLNTNYANAHSSASLEAGVTHGGGRGKTGRTETGEEIAELLSRKVLCASLIYV